MKFKNFDLIIDNKTPSKDDILKVFEIGPSGIPLYGTHLYQIEKYYIEERFLWLYCEYDNPNLYNETVLNKDTGEKEKNPKKSNQIELRNQLFVCYDLKKNILFFNDVNRKGFIKHYLNHTLQKDIEIKNIYISIEDFEKNIRCIKNMRFVQHRNLVNLSATSLFTEQQTRLGLDAPKKISTQIDCDNMPVQQAKKFFNSLSGAQQKGEFEDIVVVGLDDQDIEQIFNFKTLVQSITVDIDKDENKMLNPDEVKRIFLNELR